MPKHLLFLCQIIYDASRFYVTHDIKTSKNALNNDLAKIIMRFGVPELQNRVTQNDVTLRVTSLKLFTEILCSSN